MYAFTCLTACCVSMYQQLRTTLEDLTKNGPQEVDMLHWMGRTAMELIGRSGLGFSFDSLAIDDPGHPAAACFKEILYVLPFSYSLPMSSTKCITSPDPPPPKAP